MKSSSRHSDEETLIKCQHCGNEQWLLVAITIHSYLGMKCSLWHFVRLHALSADLKGKEQNWEDLSEDSSLANFQLLCYENIRLVFDTFVSWIHSELTLNSYLWSLLSHALLKLCHVAFTIQDICHWVDDRYWQISCETFVCSRLLIHVQRLLHIVGDNINVYHPNCRSIWNILSRTNWESCDCDCANELFCSITRVNWRNGKKFVDIF